MKFARTGKGIIYNGEEQAGEEKQGGETGR